MLRTVCVSVVLMLLVGCGPEVPEGAGLPALEQAQQGLACSASCPSYVASYRGQNGLKVQCYCSPSSMTGWGTVYGTGTYTDDSALCRAALHTGAVTSAGGDIVATIAPGQNSYTGSTQNGVTSYSWGVFPGSVTIASGPACTPPTPSCPSDAISYRGQNGTEVTCSCSSSAASNGFVWGTNIYTDDSTLCRAAVHAGRISQSGGVIKAIIRPGQSSYVGSTQNGVTSYSYGTWGGSVEFGAP